MATALKGTEYLQKIVLGILHTPLWIVYLIATNSAEHLRGRGEGNFRKQINKAVISHSPYTTAKIPGSNCFSGKLATYVNPSEKLSACRAPSLGRWDDRESSSIQVTSFSTDWSIAQQKHPVLFSQPLQKFSSKCTEKRWILIPGQSAPRTELDHRCFSLSKASFLI